MDKYIGRLLDNRYEILEVIGTGGMAVVYKAKCHRLNRLVAIKILKDDFMEDEEFRRRFHSESQAVAMLSHPNIISVYDVSTSITADYIVMELIDGITLKQYMEKKGVLNWKETLHFAIQIAKALEHAHSRGIVHRDIKPHNVMVLKNGSVKVTDFGIARVMSKGNTLTKEALGSVHYISPEQAKGGRVDNRSDIYSLGVVMYEMMSGRPPYDGESPVSVAIQHINGGAVMPSTLNPNIPGGLEQIIMRAMAHEPGGRYATATQMLADLDEFRKDPAILFDYNTPPTDEVTKLPKPVPVVETPAAQPVPQTPAAQPKEEPAEEPVTSMPELPKETPVQKPLIPIMGESPQTIAAEKEEEVLSVVSPTPRTAPRTAPRTSSAPRQAPRTAPRQAPKQTSGRPNRRPAPRPEPEDGQSKVVTATIIICAVVMVIAITIFAIVIFSNPSSTDTTIPDLVGKNYDSVKDSKDFTIRLERWVYDAEHPEGQIISQDPPAGEAAKKGATIHVVVSSGPEKEAVTMPSLLEMEKTSVQEKLDELKQKLNFEYDFKEEASATVPKGRVISTDPKAGDELKAGQMVVIYISTGPEIKKAEMPNLVGDTFEVAERKLKDQDMDLVIKREDVFHETVPDGSVIETDPAAGASIQTGDTITLKVSIGMEIKTEQMPPVANMTYEDAETLLRNMGLKLTIEKEEVYSDDVPAGEVIESVPALSEEIKTGDTVTLKVSKGPEIKIDIMPDVVGKTQEEAEKVLNDMKLHLVIDTTTTEYHATVPAGSVIRSEPILGTMIQTGNTIKLVISNGKQALVMPPVAGLTREEAEKTINDLNMGLNITVEEVFDKSVEKGVVKESTPKMGDTIQTGDTIKLVVSKGPEIKQGKMPLVVGMTKESAESELGKLNLDLNITVVEEYSSTIAAGKVIKSDPPMSSPIQTGSTITLYISKGPEIQTGSMPPVAGKTKAEAEQLLKDLNLDLEISVEEAFNDTVPAGSVISSDPAAGSQLQTGDSVKLVVSKGQETFRMPDVVNMSVSSAFNVLNTLGYNTTKLTYNYVYNDAAQDTVLEQSVAKNETISIHTEIILTVSKGPAPVTPGPETTTPTEPENGQDTGAVNV